MNNKHKQIINIKNRHKFSCVLDKWLEFKSGEIKESSKVKYYNSIEQHIKPELGDYYIEKITNKTILSFVCKMKKSGRLDGKGGLSEKTILELLTIVRCTFAYADNIGLQTNCNFYGVGLRNINAPVRVLSSEEQQKLVHYLNENNNRYTNGIMICLFTGLRIGELCALKWSNIDLKNETITVDSTIQRLQKNNDNKIKTHLVFSSPKSQSSFRTIPIPTIIVERLKEIKPMDCAPEQFVLTGSEHKYIEPRTMQNRFKKCLLETEIESVNFHCLRHTFATRCVELGVDIKVLSEILGHSSVKITLDRYVHNSMEYKKENINKLNGFVV